MGKEPNCTCAWCGKEFYRSPSQIKNETYCCQPCRHAAMRGRKKTKETNCICAQCNRMFYRQPAQIKSIVFCCHQCHMKYQTGRKQSKALVERRIDNATFRKVEKAHNWKGENRKGYRVVRCPDAFLAMSLKNGQVAYHRLVVARTLGRPLNKDERVVHIDGNIQNNSINNLKLFPTASEAVVFKRKLTQKSTRQFVAYKQVPCPCMFQSMANKKGLITEHRLVAAKALDRPLTSTEVVHHIDENTGNNTPYNLAVFESQADHSKFHLTGKPKPIYLKDLVCEK